jgi:hypothetical protein
MQPKHYIHTTALVVHSVFLFRREIENLEDKPEKVAKGRKLSGRRSSSGGPRDDGKGGGLEGRRLIPLPSAWTGEGVGVVGRDSVSSMNSGDDTTGTSSVFER